MSWALFVEGRWDEFFVRSLLQRLGVEDVSVSRIGGGVPTLRMVASQIRRRRADGMRVALVLDADTDAAQTGEDLAKELRRLQLQVERSFLLPDDMTEGKLETLLERMAHPSHRIVYRWSRLRNSGACGLARSRMLLVNTPFGPDRRLGRTGGTRRGGSRVSRRVLDRALGHRWVTDARRAPRGICRRDTGYVTRRTSWSAVSASTPNMQWHITFGAPRTRTWRPPNSSLRRPLTRSPAVRS